MAEEADRLGTGDEGLDEVLGGGLPRGGITLLTGPPGSGKTVLAAQLAFAHARAQERALFVTLLVESHERLARHLQSFAFFDAAAFGERVVVVSGSKELLEGGPQALLGLVQREAHRRRATLVVLDGVGLVAARADDVIAQQSFLYELSAISSVSACTTLLVHGHADVPDAPAPEAGLVDVVIELSDVRSRGRRLRGLEVRKLRGAEALRGVHALELDGRGATVFPRLESRALPAPARGTDARLRTGLEGLDDGLGGGLYEGSLTGLLGPPGSGKTMLGFRFLAEGLSLGEPALYLGFGEPPLQLAREAAQVGLVLDDEGRGQAGLEVRWRRPNETTLPRIGNELLQRVKDLGVRRLFIDGLTALRLASAFPERPGAFLTVLMSELAARRVTTIMSHDMSLLPGPPGTGFEELSAFADNLLLLRLVESAGRLSRVLSVLKARGCRYELQARELLLGEGGLQLGAPGAALKEAEQALPRFFDGRLGGEA